MLSLRLLGSPSVEINAQPVTTLRRKNRALLYYVAVHHEPVTRDQVLTLFWPDDERPSSQPILRTMIYDLRKELGSAFVAEEGELALADGATVDTHIVEIRLTTAPDLPSLSAALDLYRGDFLSGFTLPDVPAFEDWVALERDRFQSLLLRGLGQLSDLYERRGEYRSALDTCIRALGVDPLNEEFQRRTMRLHYWTGDRNGAIRQYDIFRRRLDDELGVPPMPQTRALYDAIITDSLPAPEPAEPLLLHRRTEPAAHAPLLPFTGRDVELRRLAEAPSNRLLLLEGEPGIGKTRLAQAFIEQQGRRALYLLGTAHELEQSLPYQPFIDALRGLLASPDWPTLAKQIAVNPLWLAEITRLIPELTQAMPSVQPSTATPDEARLWEGVHQFLLGLARLRPVVLFIDDLHWADAATLGLLGYLMRRILSPDFLILATARPIPSRNPLGKLVQALTHENRLLRIPLDRLGTEDVRALATHFSPVERDTLTHWLLHHGEGNPFFLTELVRYALSSGLLRQDGTLDSSALSWAPILAPTLRGGFWKWRRWWAIRLARLWSFGQQP